MMDDDIDELVLTVIHLQAPLDFGKFHARVLVPGYIGGCIYPPWSRNHG